MQDEIFWLMLAAAAALACCVLLARSRRARAAARPRQRARPERVPRRAEAPRAPADDRPAPLSFAPGPSAVVFYGQSGQKREPLLVLQRMARLEERHFRAPAVRPPLPELPWCEALCGGSGFLEASFPGDATAERESVVAQAFSGRGIPMGEALPLPEPAQWLEAYRGLREALSRREPPEAARLLAEHALGLLGKELGDEAGEAESPALRLARRAMSELRGGTPAEGTAEGLVAVLGTPPPGLSRPDPASREARAVFLAATAAVPGACASLPWERSVALLNAYVRASSALFEEQPSEAGPAFAALARRVAGAMDPVVSASGSAARFGLSVGGDGPAALVRDASAEAARALREETHDLR